MLMKIMVQSTYVHGNFDAISGSDKLELLGVTSFLKKMSYSV